MNKIYSFNFFALKTFILKSLLISVVFSYSQTTPFAFTDSNLPIVLITTDINPATSLPYEILDNPRVVGNMKIIKRANGTRNYITDVSIPAHVNFNGRINIEIRGSSSQLSPKKGYGLTTLLPDDITNNNVSILGMPADNDWILNSISFDKSFIRDYLCYNLSRLMGNYATKTQYCEVVVNNDYKGIYILQEKIKPDAGRVDISKILTTDNSGTNLTGGYITKSDKLTGGDPLAWLMQDVNFVHHYPDPDVITIPQSNFIKSEFDKLAENTYNQSLFDGYKTVIDIPSFVDFMLVNELSSNADVYQSSTFFHKDKNGKLRAGPIWDMNITFGSDFSIGGNSQFNQWQFSNGNRVGPDFWLELSDNGSFWCYFKKRWNELKQPGKPLNETFINTFIDNTVTLISEAMVRQELRWGTTTPNQETDISNLKTWLTQRVIWMNTELSDFTACSNVEVPPLVISKINYNPVAQTTPTLISSSDQEFIEITNNGSAPVNLSGIYFRKLGTTYQFPYNSTIDGNGVIYLAANAAVFQTKFGFTPFGQYTRNLSNKSQDIVLADAMGNVIDNVEYFDSTPWPTSADGGGSYLQLKNLNLDNNLASSWIASNAVLETQSFQENFKFTIYPNPSSNWITILASTEINKVEIIDISGKIIDSFKVNDIEINKDISSLSKGIYLVKVYTEFEISVKRLIKN